MPTPMTFSHASSASSDQPTSQALTGAVVGLALAAIAFASRDFRGNKDNILSGVVIGLIVTAGWYMTGGSIGSAWKEWAELADTLPSRVEVQSFTFISPMGDSVRYLMSPANFAYINFGVTALAAPEWLIEIEAVAVG